MKILFILATAIGVLGLIAGSVLAQSGNELFSQALLKERTEGNMAEAIKLYQTIVTKYSTDRNLVARTLLQIGLCYEKLGNEGEARKAFDRIVREYKEQKPATEATAHLAALDRDRPANQFGAIRGRVFDGDQEGVQVFALKSVYNDGQRLLTSVLFRRTNAQGDYDLSPLPPGTYYVAVPVLATATDGGVNYGLHVPMFFPNTPDPQRAKIVEVRPGATISNVDIHVVPVPVWRARGTVTGIGPFSGPENPVRGGPLNVTVMMENELPIPLMNLPPGARVNSDGSFELPRVPPGPYLLSVFQNFANAGHVALEVRDRDVEGVNIAMVPGMTVPGRIVIEPQTAATFYPGGGGFRVMLRRDPPLRGSIPLGRYTAPVANNGSFRFFANSVPVQRGDYRVSVDPILAPPTAPEGLAPASPLTLVRPPQALENTYVKSIRLGEADVLNDGLHLYEQPRQELVIVIGSNPGTLEGRVVNARKQPVSQSTVVLIPQSGIRFRVDHKFTATDASGRFRLQRIPPGDYKVFAWQDVENRAWQDPDFVGPYESMGKLIHIKEGDRQLNVEVVGIPAKR